METATKTAPKVGDILSASWGYDATFINYYKVIKVTEATVTVIEIDTVISEVTDICSVQTVAGDIKEGATPIRRKIRQWSDGYSVKINDYKYASLWDGKAIRQTASGWY